SPGSLDPKRATVCKLLAAGACAAASRPRRAFSSPRGTASAVHASMGYQAVPEATLEDIVTRSMGISTRPANACRRVRALSTLGRTARSIRSPSRRKSRFGGFDRLVFLDGAATCALHQNHFGVLCLSEDLLMPPQIVPVIICGGAGTRLWPVSRESMPKQFVPLVGQGS